MRSGDSWLELAHMPGSATQVLPVPCLPTTPGHDVVMKPVKIADLKSRQSEYLRSVRRGVAITVLDRDTPIARIVPYEPEANGLVVRRAAG